MKISPFTFADLPHINHLQPEGWLPIAPYYDFYAATDFCFPLKCEVENQIIGIGNGIVHGVSGWLAHIIVDRRFRNQGIGTLITQSLMNRLREAEVKTMLLLATPLGEPVYHKLGFEKETAYVFLKREQPLIPRSTSSHLYEPRWKEQIVKMDRLVSGENRIRLLEPHLATSYIVEDGGTLTGFFMPTLGEGLIIADTPGAGHELLWLKHSQTYYAAVPVENSNALEFLSENGFAEYRRAIRMWYGERISWQPKKLYGRIGGNLG